MRGINISSGIFLLIIVLNLTILISRKYRKRKSGAIHGSALGVFLTLLLNSVLIFLLVYFSITIGITRYNIKDERIPKEFDGFKILQISDFHSATFYGGTGKLIEKVNKEKPDIIVVTGDLIDENRVRLKPVKSLAAQLVSSAPVYFVSGNHDVWYYDYKGLQALLEKLGVKVLDNTRVTLSRGNAGINLYGISDPYTWDDKSAEEYLTENIDKLNPKSGFNILLFHRANMFDTIKGKGFQLVFSGHMHGGQLQIPFWGGLISPQQNRRWFPKYTDGKWTEAGTTMIISRGLGNNAPVPRLLNPPEIVVVTLKRG